MTDFEKKFHRTEDEWGNTSGEPEMDYLSVELASMWGQLQDAIHFSQSKGTVLNESQEERVRRAMGLLGDVESELSGKLEQRIRDGEDQREFTEVDEGDNFKQFLDARVEFSEKEVEYERKLIEKGKPEDHSLLWFFEGRHLEAVNIRSKYTDSYDDETDQE